MTSAGTASFTGARGSTATGRKRRLILSAPKRTRNAAITPARAGDEPTSATMLGGGKSAYTHTAAVPQSA
jgi:hypothetical protein